ncbi:hypothetical protein DPEC_G00177210 [Dallia pectoralis]|uniref:Uncharacterized protein n=1 Tax=Dallia pectoralis TaxID=75939 RepID=A0ACC2GF55_DALPE|nr:hypothetical protein DPEC_G00177210 [Dallia pectoralis]
MTTCVPERLLKALSGLKADELDNFHWHLIHNKLGNFEKMSTASLENASRQDTVTKMVHKYTEEKAMEITQMVLKKMGRRELAQTLVNNALEEDPVKNRNTVDEGHVSELKAKLKSDLELLQIKLDKCENTSESSNRMTQHIKYQLVTTERRIQEEFEVLGTFLRKKKEARLAALYKEEEEKGTIIERNNENIIDQVSSLENIIQAVEEDLQKDPKAFLASYKDTQIGVTTQIELPDPQLASGALIDVAKHLGNLQFQVWEQMREIVKHSPVILDPNTAPSTMRLSDDLTGVQHTAIEQDQVPDNPERFLIYAKVLGSVGFEKGSQKQSWEVVVGDQPEWNLGVAEESVNRHGEDLLASPDYGLWALQKRGSKYSDGRSKRLLLKRKPQRIRVQLDYDRGELSFYDSKDNTHIYTYKNTFTQRVYPYISVWKIKDASNNEIQICPSEVSVKVEPCQ